MLIQLHRYTATELHTYHPAGIQQDKGVPEMAPRGIAACYYPFYLYRSFGDPPFGGNY